ncbi:hypothetical protein GCM10027288_31070 [Bordetella tumbae]
MLYGPAQQAGTRPGLAIEMNNGCWFKGGGYGLCLAGWRVCEIVDVSAAGVCSRAIVSDGGCLDLQGFPGHGL